MFTGRKHGFGQRFGRGFEFGGFGPRFERGDFKLVILDLLKDKPRHGYDIIQELEKRSHGMYTPSSGTIYPTLQLLEDQDLITSDKKDGKKVHTITAQGLQYLEEHRAELDAMEQRMRGPWGDHGAFVSEIRDEFGETARLFFASARAGKLDAAKKEQLHAAFTSFREQVERILAEE